ncbi:unnamed protein product [Prunus armeniaca]|uniref:Uncharacterized protein n=1 Tax=Prunus armeniaca TaxID=36596 RepID=A0A6J5Y4M8_PRUAR|nr:unnamed protein product [Prunus armeniaca]
MRNSEASALEQGIKSTDNSRMVDGVMLKMCRKVNDAMSNPVDSTLNATVKTQAMLLHRRRKLNRNQGATDSVPAERNRNCI